MTALDVLPKPVREHLERWAETLAKQLGDELVAIVVHGSVVRGEYRPGESDVDVVVVLRDAPLATLEAIANVTDLARYSARIEATVLTEKEIAGASDCFPLLYDEIKRRHFVLVGRDPFAPVPVHDTHRRLRIEQELREAHVRLRRAVLDAAGAREVVGGAVARRLKQVRGALHALLALKGVTCTTDLRTVLAKSGETYHVDTAPLESPRDNPEQAYIAIDRLLTLAIDDVDVIPTSKG
ncbi:MAG TPA: nucleotidyltransferase domain-containing protein [Labilithrix sp.]